MKNISIEMTCPFGDELKNVLIFNPIGGGEGYNVLVNGFTQGTIFWRNNKWVGYPTKGSDLNIDDIWIIGDLIDLATDQQI